MKTSIFLRVVLRFVSFDEWWRDLEMENRFEIEGVRKKRSLSTFYMHLSTVKVVHPIRCQT